MTAEIAIGYMQHRRNYSGLFTYLLNKIKPENKKYLKIYFYTTGPASLDIQTDIQYEVREFGQYKALPGHPAEHTNNWGDKINALADLDHKYIVRTGEDVFVNPSVMDFIIENREKLEDEQNLAIIPCENLGIPSCDLFIEGFCTEEETKHIHSMFLSTDMHETAGKRWGEPELESLNAYTIRAKRWLPFCFNDAVDKFKTEKRGIHPMRFNGALQEYMCELVVNNTERFLRPREYSWVIPKIPHTCDNFCLCLQKTFRKVRQEFPFSPYEEIPMSLYMRKYGSKCLWIKNGFAYTDVYAFISRCDSRQFDKWNREDRSRYERLFKGCMEYYK